MTLLTIENLSLLQNYQTILRSKFNSNVKLSIVIALKTNNVAELDTRMSFWTSASSEGHYCALERTYAWCTTGTIVDGSYINDTQIWAAMPDGSASAGNCVALGLNNNKTSAQLSLAACTDTKSYMCQVLKYNKVKS
jgi:hypothetical protein